MGIEIISTSDRFEAAIAEPVTIEVVRDHAFEKQSKRGCGVCRGAKTAICHAGAPPSMNLLGSGNQFAYQAHKKAWQEALIERLIQATGLSAVARIVAEGHVVFPDNTKRDQGNFRVILEKAIGDALKVAGVIADDDWDRFEFGNLTKSVEAGAHMVVVTLFPFPLTAR